MLINEDRTRLLQGLKMTFHDVICRELRWGHFPGSLGKITIAFVHFHFVVRHDEPLICNFKGTHNLQGIWGARRRVGQSVLLFLASTSEDLLHKGHEIGISISRCFISCCARRHFNTNCWKISAFSAILWPVFTKLWYVVCMCVGVDDSLSEHGSVVSSGSISFLQYIRQTAALCLWLHTEALLHGCGKRKASGGDDHQLGRETTTDDLAVHFPSPCPHFRWSSFSLGWNTGGRGMNPASTPDQTIFFSQVLLFAIHSSLWTGKGLLSLRWIGSHGMSRMTKMPPRNRLELFGEHISKSTGGKVWMFRTTCNSTQSSVTWSFRTYFFRTDHYGTISCSRTTNSRFLLHIETSNLQWNNRHHSPPQVVASRIREWMYSK